MNGKTVLVTGATDGLGRGLAHSLAAAGATVLVHGRDPERIAAVSDELGSERVRGYTAREAAALDWIDAIFDAAERSHAPGVVIGMQADMWDPAAPASELSAFDAIKAVLADRAERFGKPVLLLAGDSHILKVDTPAGQPANVTRIVVQGSTNVPHEWTKLKVDPSRPSVFSCQEVEFVTKKVTPCPAPLAP